MNVHEVQQHGRPEWRVEVCVTVEGQRRRRTAYLPVQPRARDRGRRAAEAAWHQLQAAVREELRRQVDPSRQTLDEYLDAWLADSVGQRRPTTLAGYTGVLARYVRPRLGGTPLPRLAPRAIQAAVDAAAATGHRRSAALARTVLRAALADAVRLGALPDNPVDRTRGPVGAAPARVTPFTATEIEALLAAALPRWRPVLVVAATTGLRRGELCGLRWQDWDATTRVVAVERQVVLVNGRPQLQEEPKSDAGRRRFRVPARAADALEAQRAAQEADRRRFGADWRGQGWVFATHAGTCLHPRNLARAYETARRRAGLRPEEFHALRHYAVSVMLGAGVPLHVVSKRIGHSSQVVTAQTYGHLLTEFDEQAAALLDAWDARGVPADVVQ